MATITSPISSAVPRAAESAPRRRRFRYADNVYLQDGFVVIGILSTLLFLAVAVSLDAASHVDDMTMLLPVTLGACVLGVLMSFSRFDAFFALSHSLFTGLAWILYQMTPLVGENEITGILDKGISPLQAKSYVVLVAWMDWIAAAVTQQANEDNFVFIFEIAFLVWWLTFLGVWAIFRYGYTWRAIIPAGIVLVINTYYAPQSTLSFLVLFSLVALVLLVRTNLSEQQLRWREQRTYFSPDISLDFMRNALIYSVIVLAVAWILPGLGRSPQVRTLMDPVNERVEEGMEDLRVLYKGLYSSQTLGTATFTQSLTLGGPRNPGDKPVFQVDSTDGRYWRAVTYDTYDGGRWSDVGSMPAEYEAGEVVPVVDWDYRRPVTHTVMLMSDTGGVIFALADIRQADVPLKSLVQFAGGEVGGEDGEMAGPIEISLARSRKAMVAGDSYTTVSNHSEVTENALMAAGTAYPPAILERYLQLPEDFSPDVQDAAREVAADHETVYETVKSIETYLRKIPYNDQIDAPPDGVEPVEYFLFDVQEGYCDYYATSMVVMLRSLGIPARTASGYAEGKRNEDGFTILSQEDAHTWVEVYFPEYGWIEFEPTAQESTLDRPRGDEFEESGAIPGRPDEMPNNEGGGTELSDSDYDPYAGDIPQDPFPFLPDSAAADSLAPWWVWALVTPLALLLGFFLLTRTRFLGPTRFTADLTPLVFERMHGWARRLGLNLTHVQTPYEQAARVRQAFPEGEPYIDCIADSYVRYSFSEKATGESSITSVSSSQTSDAGVENVDAAWQQLRRLFWKAWLRKTILPNWRRKQNPYSLSRR